jgi:glutamyl/glutaminyl-tRNA synthetase
MTPARTRFAPSPTGSLHVGGARTALYCLLWARRTGGRFILRIEDPDRARSTDESTRGILSDLRWLGLDWDEGPEVGGDVGPYFQSQRLELYNRYLDQLLASGHAYEAWETSEELRALRGAAEAQKETFRYRRREYSADDLAGFREEGRTPVLRLAAPTSAVTIPDVVLGDVTVEPEQLDDIVIRKADGFPTYHFAVVIDDHLMGVTQVLRGQEHLMNTHKHQGLADAFGWELPAVGHMPLIFNLVGGKMSKRDKAKAARAGARASAKEGGSGKDWSWLAEAAGAPLADVDRFMAKKYDGVALAEAIARATDTELPLIELMDFRTGGYLPEALLNYLALLGWRAAEEGGGEGDKELWSVDELIAEFDLDRIKKTPARFDPAKLKWMNGEYMKSMPMEALLGRLGQHLEVSDSVLAQASTERQAALVELYRQRADTFVDLADQARFFFVAPTEWGPAKAVKKHLRSDGLERLALARDALSTDAFTSESIQATLDGLAEAHEVRVGQFAQPLRIAVSGGPVSPGIDVTLALLGRDEVLARIDACLAHFGAAS